MPKFYVSEEERYPVYVLNRAPDSLSLAGPMAPVRLERRTVDLSAEEFLDYMRVTEEFDRWQAKLSAFIRKESHA